MLFIPRVSAIIRHLVAGIVEDDPSFDNKEFNITNVYYAGGTLCVDLIFWKAHGIYEERKEVLLMCLSGHVNSTIHGDGELTFEDRLNLMAIYKKVKGETKHYIKETEDVREAVAAI